MDSFHYLSDEAHLTHSNTHTRPFISDSFIHKLFSLHSCPHFIAGLSSNSDSDSDSETLHSVSLRYRYSQHCILMLRVAYLKSKFSSFTFFFSGVVGISRSPTQHFSHSLVFFHNVMGIPRSGNSLVCLIRNLIE